MKDTLRFFSIIFFYKLHFFMFHEWKKLFIYSQIIFKRDERKSLATNLEIWSNCNWSVHFMNYSEIILQGTREENLKRSISCREIFAYALHFFCVTFCCYLLLKRKSNKPLCDEKSATSSAKNIRLYSHFYFFHFRNPL